MFEKRYHNNGNDSEREAGGVKANGRLAGENDAVYDNGIVTGDSAAYNKGVTKDNGAAPDNGAVTVTPSANPAIVPVVNRAVAGSSAKESYDAAGREFDRAAVVNAPTGNAVIERAADESTATENAATGSTAIGSAAMANASVKNAATGSTSAVKAKHRGNMGRKVCALVLSAAMFGSVASVAFFGVNTFLNKSAAGGLSSSATLKTTATGSAASGPLDVSAVASENMAAMVSINTISVEDVRNYFGMFGNSASQQVQGSGSGIIIAQNDEELMCVTNAHVIDGATNISVSFADGTVADATVKGSDTDNDLAVISVKLSDISDDTKNQIKTATLGDSSALTVGQQVVAIGNALGYGQSVTTGIVSVLNCTLDDSKIPMIQTDAAINPGNSGGALLNMNGEVVGINSAKAAATEVEGMGYAISITDALPIIEQLMNGTSQNGSDDQSTQSGQNGSNAQNGSNGQSGSDDGTFFGGFFGGSQNGGQYGNQYSNGQGGSSNGNSQGNNSQGGFFGGSQLF